MSTGPKKMNYYWQENETAVNCNGCNKPFSLTLRKHHCRSCGYIFCSACSSKTTALPEIGYNENVRVCDKCYVRERLENMMFSIYNASGESRKKEEKRKKEEEKRKSRHQNRSSKEDSPSTRRESSKESSKESSRESSREGSRENLKENPNTDQANRLSSPRKDERHRRGVSSRRRSHTARDEISPVVMKEILQKAGINLNEKFVNQLLISFDNTATLVAHVNEEIDRKEEEDVKQMSAKYEMEKIQILTEIDRRHQYCLS